jgi:2-polyprenyl-3-methyl-5-hydroxy-6-metoxy-1,4-benzoquinol methylase
MCIMLAREFYETLTAEITDNVLGLDTKHYQEMQRYYLTSVDNLQRRSFNRYNWIRRTEPMVRLLNTLPRRNEPWRVLDAGCGLGTESIFWSTLRDDIQVLSVDLSARRLGVAQARCSAYERHLGRALSVRFLEQDVFTVLNSEGFDVVWTMEAISHIDPAEQFIADVAKNLGERGHLVVSDSHIWNPAMAWRVLKLRRQGVTLRTQKTTSGGRTVSYAQERLLTVGWLSSILKEAGFASVQTQSSVFFPPKLARSPELLAACVLFDRVMNRLPVIRNLGGIYTLVAGK